MGYFTCRCGNEIDLRDIPYEAEAAFIPQHAEESLIDGCATEIAEFVAAVISGRRAEWITTVFSPAYVEFSDKIVIEDLLSKRWSDKSRSLLECPVCGRIYLERVQPNKGYLSFRPEPVIQTPSRMLQSEDPDNSGFVTTMTKGAASTWFGVDGSPVPPGVREDYGRLINRDQPDVQRSSA